MQSKSIGHFLLATLVCVASGVLYYNSSSTKTYPPQTSGEEYTYSNGNRNVDSFHEAKKILRRLYAGHETTFYCGCTYSEDIVNLNSCGYVPVRSRSRAHRIEWEHIVPTYDFGRSFSAWREGHKDCVDRKGRSFKGRNCTRLVSAVFRKMEGDLFNIVPEIGEINAVRSNYPMGVLPAEIPPTFGSCLTKVMNQTIEPRPEIRGFIARVYKYMDYAYPGHGIISRKNAKMFEAWDKMYPPDEFELWRAEQIEKVQGNKNPMIMRREARVL